MGDMTTAERERLEHGLKMLGKEVARRREPSLPNGETWRGSRRPEAERKHRRKYF